LFRVTPQAVAGWGLGFLDTLPAGTVLGCVNAIAKAKKTNAPSANFIQAAHPYRTAIVNIRGADIATQPRAIKP
jgi:hypothetical protein